ncbi:MULTISPECIES: phosphoadenosine phosphosulfate reductase [Pacificibacter]|uniref:phosphoadenosine phosphosulfate reductase n=1 Tax=Pacificibacter TaxID=1042323 RepID=UPI001C0929F6|nr:MULTISPECIES: phosphoadenosine phosphosulfate reductase [Pacificibacter]MBU2935687.1 phosphoadenosine phosphosulfate reductase [Pacificibacter marinus]MDO6614183.1 phosphoadenosine phosphosulfate reductase [Pacificibacter sp. 1_MG-2023]
MDHTPDTDGPRLPFGDISDLPRDEWLEAIEDIGEEAGYFEPLGKDHCVMFLDDSPRLLVTFESYESITERSDDGLPLGLHFAQKNGWSHLAIIAHGSDPTSHWFRTPNIYGYFDRLVNDGFFEDFDQVAFYGAGASGYAACAYSVAAPSATVIAIAPQATLDARLTSWDTRFGNTRRMDFTTRYGFAPDMVDAADTALVLYDPQVALDAMHAALFNRPHTRLRPLRNFGADPEFEMLEMNAVEPLLVAAMDGDLNTRNITRALRNRHDHMGHLRRLLNELTAKDRPVLTLRLCNHVLKTRDAWRFRKAQKAAKAAIADRRQAAQGNANSED